METNEALAKSSNKELLDDIVRVATDKGRLSGETKAYDSQIKSYLDEIFSRLEKRGRKSDDTIEIVEKLTYAAGNIRTLPMDERFDTIQACKETLLALLG